MTSLGLYVSSFFLYLFLFYLWITVRSIITCYHPFWLTNATWGVYFSLWTAVSLHHTPAIQHGNIITITISNSSTIAVAASGGAERRKSCDTARATASGMFLFCFVWSYYTNIYFKLKKDYVSGICRKRRWVGLAGDKWGAWVTTWGVLQFAIYY